MAFYEGNNEHSFKVIAAIFGEWREDVLSRHKKSILYISGNPKTVIISHIYKFLPHDLEAKVNWLDGRTFTGNILEGNIEGMGKFEWPTG
jgi:hypothetical protein